MWRISVFHPEDYWLQSWAQGPGDCCPCMEGGGILSWVAPHFQRAQSDLTSAGAISPGPGDTLTLYLVSLSCFLVPWVHADLAPALGTREIVAHSWSDFSCSTFPPEILNLHENRKFFPQFLPRSAWERGLWDKQIRFPISAPTQLWPFKILTELHASFPLYMFPSHDSQTFHFLLLLTGIPFSMKTSTEV